MLSHQGAPVEGLYALDFCEDEFVQAGLLPDECQVSPASSANKPGTPDVEAEFRAGLHEASPANAHTARTPHRQSKLFPRHTQGSGKEMDLLGYKKQVNKEHQRRFRERQKVRSQKLETQLTKLTQELETMKLQHRLLERQLAQGDTAAPASANQNSFQADPTKTEPPLNISLPGREYKLTVADVINMPTHDFNTLCKEYIKELKNCLSAMQYNANDQIRDRLAQLVLPALRLRGTRCVARNAMQADAPASPKVDDSWQLTGPLALSQNQYEDLLFLQRVYVLKKHELNEKRTGLTSQIQNGSQNFLADVSKMATIATELKQNAASALQLAKKFCWALYFGVLTMEQSAHVIMQLGLPKSPTEDALQNIVANRALPTTEDILAGQDGSLASQTWDRFWDYAQSQNPYEGTSFEYVPIPEARSEGMTLKLY